MKGWWIARTAAAVLAGGLAASGVRAEESGVLMKSILGTIGIIPEDRPAIDYRERAPLVLPPKLDLREPVATNSAEARSPQWPSDPDLAARRREQAEARVPLGQPKRDALSPDELRAGRRATSSYSQPTPSQRADRDSGWVNPEVLRAQRSGGGGEDTSVLAGGEPNRVRLAQPPTGLRKPLEGAPVKADSEPVVREEAADPYTFQRQQARR